MSLVFFFSHCAVDYVDIRREAGAVNPHHLLKDHAADKGRKSRREMIEPHPDPPRRPHILVHRDPHFQFAADRLRQVRQQFRKAPRDVVLATAGLDACLQRRQPGDVDFAAEVEMVPRQRPRQRQRQRQRAGYQTPGTRRYRTACRYAM